MPGDVRCAAVVQQREITEELDSVAVPLVVGYQEGLAGQILPLPVMVGKSLDTMGVEPTNRLPAA